MNASTYRRKCTECQAIQWTGDNAAELEEFTGGRFTEIDLEDRDDDATGDLLESKHSSHVRVYPGNWIVHEGIGFRVMDDQSFTEEYAPAEPVRPVGHWTIVRAVQTCFACPSQWDAWTDTGDYLYLRFRYGCGTVTHYPDSSHNTSGTHISDFEHGGDLAGSITLEEFCAYAGLTLRLETPVTEGN